MVVWWLGAEDVGMRGRWASCNKARLTHPTREPSSIGNDYFLSLKPRTCEWLQFERRSEKLSIAFSGAAGTN
jgi:hypothetical protein